MSDWIQGNKCHCEMECPEYDYIYNEDGEAMVGCHTYCGYKDEYDQSCEDCNYEIIKDLNDCLCGGKPEFCEWEEGKGNFDGYTIRCKSCGKTTKNYCTIEEAKKDWQSGDIAIGNW